MEVAVPGGVGALIDGHGHGGPGGANAFVAVPTAQYGVIAAGLRIGNVNGDDAQGNVDGEDLDDGVIGGVPVDRHMRNHIY